MQSSDLPSIKQIAVKHIHNFHNRPTIVFLHDSLGCIELWRDFPEKLGQATQCNILVYDRQGYGNSCSFSNSERDNNYMEPEANLLNELLIYYGIENAILFGHSDGGSIALLTAAKYPEKVAGVITEGAHIFVEDVTLKGIQEAIALYNTTDLKSKLEKYHGEKTDAMFWAWAGTWTTTTFRDWNMEHFLAYVTCPSLIIQGEDDEYGTLAQVNGIVNQVSGAVVSKILPKVKHTPHKEVTEIIIEVASDFINKIV